LASSADQWTPDDERLLLDLLDNGATKLEFLEAFPYRRWMSMVKKLRSIRGKGVSLPNDPNIHFRDTLADVQQRMGMSEFEQAEKVEMGSNSGSPMAGRMPNSWR